MPSLGSFENVCDYLSLKKKESLLSTFELDQTVLILATFTQSDIFHRIAEIKINNKLHCVDKYCHYFNIRRRDTS